MNYTNCPHCGGKLRVESIGWICEKCRGFIDMQGNFHEHVEKPFMPPITNADRIRLMSDEELYKFIISIADDGWPFACQNRPECDPVPPQAHLCYECFMKWLQRPAEEG